MSKALYRKYRSKSLGDIVGQSHITEILERSIKQGRVAHAYLLTGPRGVGKTSIARILAHEINALPYNEEETHLDIIEIDAASNNGVEDVRELREKVQVAPVSASKKIYIIDEVHMLSKQAFNALLKTLEEPPEHAVFILATTDADKLPATIVSRTQRFSFKAITTEDAVKHLTSIAKAEKISIDDDALQLVAERGDGSFRDSISLLDQIVNSSQSNGKITRQDIERSLGLAPAEHVKKILDAYEAKDLSQIVALLNESEASGVQTTVLASQLQREIRELITKKPQLIELLSKLIDVTSSSQPDIKLLTILGAHAAPKPKTAALSAPDLVVSAPIAELERQATKAKPRIKEPVEAKPAAAPTTEKPPKQTPTGENLAFNWDSLVDYAKQNFVAVYSVLSKCSYEIDDGNLTLYTGNAFYKKKLDDSKHRVNLLKALEETGAGDVILTTIGTPPPPKDSNAAAVAVIMGGGVEVNIDE